MAKKPISKRPENPKPSGSPIKKSRVASGVPSENNTKGALRPPKVKPSPKK